MKIKQKTGTTRLTKNYKRKRIRQPSEFKKNSFRTKKLPGGKVLILGKPKNSTKMKIQAILTPRKHGK